MESMGSKFCTDSLYIVTYVANNIDILIEIMPSFADMDQTQESKILCLNNMLFGAKCHLFTLS